MSETKTLAVTGATGYLAAWVIRELLERGHTVHATARSLADAKVGWLREMAEGYPGELKLFAADLLDEGSFDAAIEGCEVVVHTASPFFFSDINDPQRELVDPAKKGTANVLESVNRTQSVRRVVLTSSVASIAGDAVECDARPLTEDDWNESSSLEHQPYSFSKVEAEREAWRIAKAQDRWQLVTVNPGFILGPSIPPDRSSSESVKFMTSMIEGEWATGTMDHAMSCVDVRDVAHAHAEAALREQVEGRHICTAEEFSFVEIGRLLKSRFGKRVKPPTRVLPTFLVWLTAPLFGIKREFVKRNAGHRYRFDNQKSVQALGMNYRAIDETIIEHAQQILEQRR